MTKGQGIWHHSDETRKKLAEKNRGKNNPQWKGGKTKNVGGWILVKRHNHPFKNTGGYVFEHRLVMEQWLCEHDPNNPALIEIDGERYLRPEYDIHHINDIRDDNRIENLKLMKHGEHSRFHNTGRHLSEETKKKMSLSLKGNIPWNKGKTFSEEARKKMSLSQKEWWSNPDNVEKIRERNEKKIGICHSEETKRKMSLSQVRQHAERRI